LEDGVEIEIYADVICPWCYLGKRRLDAALATYDGDVTLRWRAYQLDPSTPREAVAVLQWLGRRYGGPEQARRMTDRVAGIAAAEGLHLHFDRALVANTFDAHRLLSFAGSPEAVVFGANADTQARVAEALHAAHFTDGLDIASTDVLVAVAGEVGLDEARVRRLLTGSEGVPELQAELAEAYELGITSVPTFVFEGRYAVTGAQDSATLRSVLDEVARLSADPDAEVELAS
jgi:predicted DsbA family dithiol-disulfide isomerase